MAKRSALIVIFLSVFYNAAFSQNVFAQRNIAHKAIIGLGYGYNSFFDGFSTILGYEFHFNKNFISAAYYKLEQFTIGNSDPQKTDEWCLLYNRELINKPIYLSIGAGLAYTSIFADIRNFIGPLPSGIYYQSTIVTRSVISFPLNLNLSLPSKRKLSTGLNVHSNLNAALNIYSAGIFLSYKF